MSQDLFLDIARSIRAPGSPVANPDAQPADANDLFLEIARQAIPQPAQPDPAAPQPSMARQAMGMAGQVGAGFNESLASTAGGLPDLYNRLLRSLGLPALPEGAYTRAAQSGLNAITGAPPEPAGQGERIARGVGRGVGDAAGIFLPATAAASLPGMTGRVAGALAAQPVAQAVAGGVGGAVGEATESPLLGAAAALATPLAFGAARRVLTPVQTPVDPVRDRLAAVADREGIPLTLAQRSGSRPLQTMEAVFETMPLTAGRQQAVVQNQRDAFTGAALRASGGSGARATPDVLADIEARVGGTIGAIAQRTTAQITPDIANNVQAFAADVARNAAPEVRDRILNRVRDVLALANPGGAMEGRAVRELDSAIGQQIRSAQGDVRSYLRDVQGFLRDAMRAGATPDDAAALDEARRQYANLVRVESAMAAAGPASALGNVNPASLRHAVSAGNRRGYATGRGDMDELARVGEAFVRPAVPNSGTPERTMMAGMLTGQVAAQPGSLSALLLPPVAQSIYNQPMIQTYLGNRLMNNRGPDINRALLAAILAQNPSQIPVMAGAAGSAAGNAMWGLVP